MRQFSRRSITLGISLLPLLAAPAWADAAQDAVNAYIAKTAADAQTASDRLVAMHANDLLHDSGSAFIGNANGDVTIVEFFDYNCPFSRAAEPRVQALLNSDPGVKLILKEFTIEGVPSSQPAARAALASVAQGKYPAYHQAMMFKTGHTMAMDEIFDDATKVGLDVTRLRADMEKPAFYNQLIANFNLARALRVFQTPTFIVFGASSGHIVTQPSAEIDFPKLVATARGK